ncbi:uncharacterized protein RJT20DRAFT_37545 [Scheffersomyces xylosifermentans]|uniref:uncharacterized protein n=1 Tax=Scheffersomyces xylosifermentans TaxID=1304137 RepID=UPI00315DE5FD
MIRGNWSLSAELKKSEQKHQQKVQQRQKNLYRSKRLQSVDPIRLYKQIQNLEKDREVLSERDRKHLKGLKEDWEFIQKNNLHQTKIKAFLAQEEQKQKQQLIAKTKLWGSKSIYFNPELNPLGKVPGASQLHEKLVIPLPNLTKPLKPTNYTKYEVDPVLSQLDVVLPQGEPPRFYKLVQNTEKPNRVKSSSQFESKEVITAFVPRSTKRTKQEVYDDDEEEKKEEDEDEEKEEGDSSDEEIMKTDIAQEVKIEGSEPEEIDDEESNLAPEEEAYLVSIGKLPAKKQKLS